MTEEEQGILDNFYSILTEEEETGQDAEPLKISDLQINPAGELKIGFNKALIHPPIRKYTRTLFE